MQHSTLRMRTKLSSFPSILHKVRSSLLRTNLYQLRCSFLVLPADFATVTTHQRLKGQNLSSILPKLSSEGIFRTSPPRHASRTIKIYPGNIGKLTAFLCRYIFPFFAVKKFMSPKLYRGCCYGIPFAIRNASAFCSDHSRVRIRDQDNSAVLCRQQFSNCSFDMQLNFLSSGKSEIRTT